MALDLAAEQCTATIQWVDPLEMAAEVGKYDAFSANVDFRNAVNLTIKVSGYGL